MQIQDPFLLATSLESGITANILTVTPSELLSDVLELIKKPLLHCPLDSQTRSLDSFSVKKRIAQPYILVVENGCLLGIVTEHNLLRALISNSQWKQLEIREIMSSDYLTIQQSDVKNIFTVISLFNQHYLQILPIVDADNILVGIIAIETLLETFQIKELLPLQKVKNFFNHDLLTIQKDQTLLEIAHLITQFQANLGIVNNYKSCGIITVKDLLIGQILELDLTKITGEKVMNFSLPTIQSEDSLAMALSRLQQEHYPTLIVNNSHHQIIGQISNYDLLKVFDPLEICRVLTYRQLELERKISSELPISSQDKTNLDWRELEIRIQSRTYQLRHLNQQLIREIEERKTVEKSLRESEERLRKIITTNADALLVIDQEGKVLFINPAAEVLLGRKAEALLGELLGLPIIVNELAEVEIIRPNRQLIFAEMRVVELTWQQDQIVYLASLRDITEKKKADEIIRASEEELRSTFEQVAVGIAHLNLRGKFLKVNQTFCNILGYSEAEILEKTFMDISLPDSLEQDWQLLEQLLNNQLSSFVKEKYYYCKDGSLICGKVTVSVVHDAWENPDHFIIVLENITDQKQAEKALLESQKQYQELVNSVEAIVWEAEFPNYQLLFISQTVEKLLGYSIEECLNNQDIWLQHIHEEDREKMVNLRKEALKNHHNYQLEYRMIASDSRQVWLRDIVTVISKDFQTIKLQGITVDISQQKQVENSLKESQNRLQLLNSITTRITAGMRVNQIIELTVQQIQDYFPELRVAYATVNFEGYAIFSCALQPKFMPSVKDLGFELSEIPEIWHTLNMGIPVIIEEVSQDPRLITLKNFFLSNGTKSFICVPLQQWEQMGGLLFLDSSISRQWSQYEILLLRDVADYLSVAIKETQAQQQRFEMQSQLIEQSKHLEKFSLNLKKLHTVNTHEYERIDLLFTDYLKIGCDIFNLSTGIISKIRSDCYIIQSVVSDLPELNYGFVMPLEETFCGRVVQEKNTVIYQNIPQDQILRTHPAYQRFKIKNYLGTPLIVNGQIYGTLSFFSSKNRQEHFEEYEQEFIELMAQSLGKYIEANQTEKERQVTLEELRKNQTFIQRIAQTIPSLLYIYDLMDNRNIYINAEIASILGYTTEEVQAMEEIFIRKLIIPEYREQLTKHLQEFNTVKDGDIVEIEYQIKHKNGSLRWLYSRDILFSRTLDGKPKQILGTATDITRQKSIESELQETNNKLINWVKELEQRNREISLLGEMTEVLQACLTIKEAYHAFTTLLIPLFPNSSGAVFILNNTNNLLEAVAHWGKPLEENLFTSNECWGLRRGRIHWVKQHQHHLVCPHVENFTDLTESLCIPLMAQGETLGLLWLSLFADSGETKFTESTKQLAITVSEHISLALANLQLRETLQNQSVRDPLTSLFNRRYMEESLAREIHRAERKGTSLGILMLDLDYFKSFNDRFGHELGDKVLKELGYFLTKSIRNSDIACRYGGEEFMLILPDTTLEDTVKRAQQICQGVKQLQIEYHYQSIGSLSISIGVAIFPDHGLTVENLVWAADAALYQAKAQGRDRVVLAQYCRKN